MVMELFVHKDLPLLRVQERGRITDINGEVKKYRITKVIPILQSDLPEEIKGKVYVLQRLEFDDGREYFRFGYYILGKKPKMRGKWVWGQYCPIGPMKDLKKIIEEAEKIKS